jgi:hypothetical protein
MEYYQNKSLENIIYNHPETRELMTEKWLPIIGYEGYYEVSDLGRVKSIKRTVPNTRKGVDYIRERILSQHFRRYSFVVLTKFNKTTNKTVHRLTAVSFIDNPENKAQINHKDGITYKNSIYNLEWNTSFENMQHSVRTGLKSIGENQSQAKLNNKQVYEIRELNKSMHIKEIAIVYGVQKPCIWKIVNNKTWKHLL